MIKTTVYGLPLNPQHLLEQLAGASFCISYATRQRLGKQLDDAIRLVGKQGILLVDNGAFSLWNQGVSTRDESYIEAYEAWANDILDRCEQAIAVIPDIIDGTEAENAELVRTTMLDVDRAMPIWHMHESLEYFLWLCESFSYVGIGSSGEYANVKSPKWHARIAEMFAALEKWEEGNCYIRPRLHMMRAQEKAHLFDFDSSDSTNVAVNHNRFRRTHEIAEGHVAQLAARVSAKITDSCTGIEAEHQEKRPLLDHITMREFRAQFALDLIAYKAELLADRFTVTVRELPADWQPALAA